MAVDRGPFGPLANSFMISSRSATATYSFVTLPRLAPSSDSTSAATISGYSALYLSKYRSLVVIIGVLNESAKVTLTSETFTEARSSALIELGGTLAHAESVPSEMATNIKRIVDILRLP